MILQCISSSTSGLLLQQKCDLLTNLQACLSVHLFFVSREVKDHLNYEHRVFNSEEFLKTRATGDQPFYRKVNVMLNILCISVVKLHFRINAK